MHKHLIMLVNKDNSLGFCPLVLFGIAIQQVHLQSTECTNNYVLIIMYVSYIKTSLFVFGNILISSCWKILKYNRVYNYKSQKESHWLLKSPVVVTMFNLIANVFQLHINYYRTVFWFFTVWHLLINSTPWISELHPIVLPQ